jgi:hypothetical protein
MSNNRKINFWKCILFNNPVFIRDFVCDATELTNIYEIISAWKEEIREKNI